VIGTSLQAALVISVLSLSTDAFVPTKRATGTVSSTSSRASWKDLPLPELPPQTVNGVKYVAQQQLPDFLADLKNFNLPSVDFSSLPHLPDQVNAATLSNVMTAFLTTQWQLEAIAIFTVGNLFYRWLNSPLDFSRAPFQPGTDTYSPAKSDAFYQERPGMVLKRLIKLGYMSGAFTTGLLFDWLVLGKLFKDEEYTALKKAEPRRAKEALRLCEQLGPTFIKLVSLFFWGSPVITLFTMLTNLVIYIPPTPLNLLGPSSIVSVHSWTHRNALWSFRLGGLTALFLYSIRQDLIPELYALELRALQDAVPPFPNEAAQDILKKEFGVDDLSRVFSELTQSPVAAASVGQVYKGVLASDGITEVAVKVQRPGILAEIALDLYILRLLTPIQTRLQNIFNGVVTEQEDIDLAVALVDEWGRGFVAETDYRLEAQNTINFEAAMRKRGLDAVCAPTVVEELVRDKVLVTEWVQGTRLDLDVSPDVPRLCGVAINAYLTMLLDTGVLHCDPHKGNLLRTADGRLCILDWGMTLDVPSDLQYALLEFIAHINVEDYDAIPQDFINLGFSPPDVTPERLQQSGITEGLSFAFRQLAAGGGPKKIQERVKQEFLERYGSDLSDEELRLAARADMMQRMEAQLASEGVDVKGVTNIMEEVSRRNRELFSLPPYVLYLARAFSTLEGIGLSIDENYSIIQECYPYLASRLFTDRNPRAKKALKAMLGLSDEQIEDHVVPQHQAGSAPSAIQRSTTESLKEGQHRQKGLSPAKFVEMSEGFTSYTAATANVDRDGSGQMWRSIPVTENAGLRTRCDQYPSPDLIDHLALLLPWYRVWKVGKHRIHEVKTCFLQDPARP
jgi:predicted unusual protein kinase regulating ubiquinone biosynthesis (AarF/ABC1/UbiB family)